MKFVFASYVVSNGFSNPETWLEHIKFYTGIFEKLSYSHQVESIEQINYEGAHSKNGVGYFFLRLNKFERYFPQTLHKFIKGRQPDVVIIQGTHFPLQVIQLRLKLGWGVKIMVHHHAEVPFTGIKKYAQRFADKFIDGYLFASKAMGLEWVTKGNLASPKKIHEVMEASSLFYPVASKMAIQRTGTTGNPVFLWVGRLNANKDPLNAVNAFLKFAEINPSARLYMIYHTEELLEEIKQIIARHAHKNAVKLVGKVPHNDLLYWYNSAGFLLSCSHYEGSGVAVCEATSCGCIPVVSNIFSFRMMTDSGNCGILFEPGNETALLHALLQTQQIDQNEKRKLCLDYFKSNLSFEAIAIKIQEIAGSL